jgi:hypothetical protein
MRSLFLLLTVVLAACTSGSPTSSEPGASGTTGDAATTAAAGGGATAAPQSDAGPSFTDIVRSGKLATYRISYKMTTTGGGQDNASVEQTWYFKPPKTRLDFSGGDGYGGASKISMFFLETGTFLCTEASGAKTCLQTSSEAAAGQNLGFEIQQDFRDDPAAFNATLREARTIAGQQALCYLVRGAAAGFAEGTFYYTRTGVPLLSQWSGGGASITMEATSFTANVPDSDFALPVTPIRVP